MDSSHKNVLVVTLTHNRLETTKRYLGELREKAGYPFFHVVVDNGSTDGTVEWLRTQDIDLVVGNKKNVGILAGWNQAVATAVYPKPHGGGCSNPDYILKFDDDCRIITDGILARCVEFLEAHPLHVVGPEQEGLAQDSEQMPALTDECTDIGGYPVLQVTHVGGIFCLMTYAGWECIAAHGHNGPHQRDAGWNLPGAYSDDNMGDIWRANDIQPVYLTDLKIAHEGQRNAHDIHSTECPLPPDYWF